MSSPMDNGLGPFFAPRPWQEIQGTPKPDAQDTAEETIRKIMNPIKREQSRNSLPDLAPD